MVSNKIKPEVCCTCASSKHFGPSKLCHHSVYNIYTDAARYRSYWVPTGLNYSMTRIISTNCVIIVGQSGHYGISQAQASLLLVEFCCICMCTTPKPKPSTNIVNTTEQAANAVQVCCTVAASPMIGQTSRELSYPGSAAMSVLYSGCKFL